MKIVARLKELAVALPALLEIAELAQRLIELRRTDQSEDWLTQEREAEAKLEEALSELAKVEVG